MLVSIVFVHNKIVICNKKAHNFIMYKTMVGLYILLLPHTHCTYKPLCRAVTLAHICHKANSLLRLLLFPEEVVNACYKALPS